jgi:hypothetical protein
MLDIGLSNFLPSRSIFGYSHPAPASRPAQIVTPPGLRASSKPLIRLPRRGLHSRTRLPQWLSVLRLIYFHFSFDWNTLFCYNIDRIHIRKPDLIQIVKFMHTNVCTVQLRQNDRQSMTDYSFFQCSRTQFCLWSSLSGSTFWASTTDPGDSWLWLWPCLVLPLLFFCGFSTRAPNSSPHRADMRKLCKSWRRSMLGTVEIRLITFP